MRCHVRLSRIPTALSAHDARGFVMWGFAKKGAMTAVTSMNLQAVLRRILDAFVSAWMRRTATEAEQAQPHNASHRYTP